MHVFVCGVQPLPVEGFFCVSKNQLLEETRNFKHKMCKMQWGARTEGIHQWTVNNSRPTLKRSVLETRNL